MTKFLTKRTNSNSQWESNSGTKCLINNGILLNKQYISKADWFNQPPDNNELEKVSTGLLLACT